MHLVAVQALASSATATGLRLYGVAANTSTGRGGLIGGRLRVGRRRVVAGEAEVEHTTP